MPTINQLFCNFRKLKSKICNTKALVGCPQKKGVCLKIKKIKPKKPNSARRRIARVRLVTKKTITAYIPGQGHNLKEFSRVLVRGGRANDLPGVRYTLIRGCYDFSFRETFFRRNKRSKYGWKKDIV